MRVVEILSVHVMKTAGVSFHAALQYVYGEVIPAFAYLGQPIRPRRGISLQHTYIAKKALWRKTMAKVGPEVRVLAAHIPVQLYDGLFPGAKRVVWLRHPVHRLISRYLYFWHPGLDFDIHEYIKEDRAQNVMTYFTNGGDLKRFFFVGIAEHFKRDLARLARLLKWPSGYPVVRKNVCKHPRLKAKLLADRALAAEIRRLNQKDIRLYQRALERRAA